MCIRAGLVHCSRLHASERSERLAAESQGLRRQEIKHEMKTSSSLNILASHFPISPLPFADFKRREEKGLWGERLVRGGSLTKRLRKVELSYFDFYK